MSDYHLPPELRDHEAAITAWLQGFAAENPAFEAIDRGEPSEHAEPRWYVRLTGDEKPHTTIWFTLGQRTLRYETYVIATPVPEDDGSPAANMGAVCEWALRRNEKIVGAHFSIGIEDALFLRGELPLASLSEAELDRVIGSLYAYVEHAFPILARMVFPQYFT